MQCPACQFENPEGMKFCGNCGSRFGKICPDCDTNNPINFMFCGECGRKLPLPPGSAVPEPSLKDQLEKIGRYLPSGLTDKILLQKNKIEGERKLVTVMFCDLEGFTSISERLGPEKMYGIMDRVYEILIHKVREYEGTVNEMTGDGIMALFGAPIALEDAPQRAIRAGMAVHREMAKFSDQQKSDEIGPLKMRIGIHTGPVVVGTLGNDLRVEFKAVGDTVNLASRMENLAEPGATYVTEETFKLTEGLFRFESLGEKAIKGRKDKVNVYRVVFTSSRRTRFDVSTERGLSPFVGRNREIELLMDGFERSKSGRGQAFSIMAEAGVGKSRLLYEFRKSISNENVSFYEGKCLSYSRGVAYHPVVDILKSNFDILESDDCDAIRNKVVGWLKKIGVDESGTLPYLLELLSVKDSGIDQLDLSVEARKDRILSAVITITLKGSEIRPLIVAVEDLHWVDKSSEEIFRFLLESITGGRVFLIFTYRPEYMYAWGGKSYHSQINLNRLSNRESLAMVSHILGPAEVDKEIEELVLDKTEGVPFFIEEFLKSLKDLKIIEASQMRYRLVKDAGKVTIPSTIQEVIMARVDSLPEGPRDLLQIGSAIGREFSFNLIQQVADLPERKLLQWLSVLKDTELVYERGIYPLSTYIFKHALTQEVVYEAILGRRKKVLHGKIGKAIEVLHKENIDEHLEVLSDHFIRAEKFEAGEEYCRLVCKKAVKKASFEDVVTYGRQRIDCLERLPQTESVEKKIVDARTMLGFNLYQIGYFVESKEAVSPAVELAVKHGCRQRIRQLKAIEGAYYFWVKEDVANAVRILQEVIQDATAGDDPLSLIMSHSFLANATGLNCEFERALANYQGAMDFYAGINSKRGVAINKGFQSYFVYGFRGDADLSCKTSKEALQLAGECGDILSMAHAFICYGNACYLKGRFEEAVKYLTEGAVFCERINLFSWEAVARWTLGDIYHERGDYENSKSAYLATAFLLQKNQIVPSWMRLSEIAVEREKALKGEKEVDMKAIYKHAAENKIRLYDGMCLRFTGEVLRALGSGHLQEAESWLCRAIEADRTNGVMFYLAKDHVSYGELCRQKGDIGNARANLSAAIEIFNKCGADGWAERVERDFAT